MRERERESLSDNVGLILRKYRYLCVSDLHPCRVVCDYLFLYLVLFDGRIYSYIFIFACIYLNVYEIITYNNIYEPFFFFFESGTSSFVITIIGK